MTLASSISLAACALEIGVGLMALSLSGAPGWRHLRLLAFVSLTAAAYSASNIPQTLTESVPVVVVASRLSLFSIALHLMGWIAYSAPRAEGRARLGRLDRGLLAALLATSVLALWPGALAAPRVLVHEVPWLGLRYATAEPTALAEASFLFFLAAMLVPAWRFVQQVRRRTPGALAQALGFAVLVATGANEALVAARLVSTPYLLDLGFLAVVLPITGEVSRRLVGGARSLAESERRHTEHHRHLLEGMTDAYAAVSLDDRIEEANEAFTRLVGYSIDELRALTFVQLTPERWHAEERRILDEQVLVHGSSEVYEKEYRRKDGTILPVELRTFLIRGEGSQPVGMWAIVRDIGERKRAEDERERLRQRLMQSQKLESIGRLAGGVAHDFNNLLTVILSCSNAIREDLAAGLPANPEDVAEIHAAGIRARDVTRQLLAFARKQVIAPVVLDPNEVLRGSEKLLKRVLGEDVQLRVDLEPGAWPVHCDPGQLEQVILNLALNARDAMPGGGTLVIETRNLPAGQGPPPLAGAPPCGGWVLIVVRDTGSGMSPELQMHLFEPFFTTKGQGLGTGLGLATVHGIVTQSGGQVTVHSEPGRGTAFHIHLPRAEQPAAPASPPQAPRALGGSETILLVEDERPVREVTARALRNAGYRVLVAQDGAEALEIAAREDGRLHMLVTDVVMPGLDGRALAEEVRRRRGPLGVLYLSGYSQDVISHHGILDAGVHFLEKPYTPEVLLARVRSALDAS